MAFCSKCGTELTEGAKFCPKCGNPTGSSETKEMVGGDSSNCSLELVSAGFAKLQVVKALREIFGIGLKEAKDMVDSTPLEIAKNLTLTEAKKIAIFLSTAGAKSIVKQNGKTIFIEEPSQNFNPQTEEQGGNKLMKYGAYVFGALCFLYILGTCVGGSSDGQEETQIEQKQESATEHKESNPYAKFAGTYTLYDDYGGIQQKPMKVINDGRFIAESGKTVEPEVLGSISILSDKAFSLYLSEQLWLDYKVSEYQGKNTVGSPLKISWGHTLVFDLSEKRMYKSESDYRNRDVSSPTYMKFKFTKN